MHRRIGIGCDQLILIEKSDDYDAFMRIYNNDGLKQKCVVMQLRVAHLMAGTKTEYV